MENSVKLTEDEVKKIRRRIEDALRKTATPEQIVKIASLLNVRTTE